MLVRICVDGGISVVTPCIYIILKAPKKDFLNVYKGSNKHCRLKWLFYFLRSSPESFLQMKTKQRKVSL